jgi:hypothetical protein
MSLNDCCNARRCTKTGALAQGLVVRDASVDITLSLLATWGVKPLFKVISKLGLWRRARIALIAAEFAEIQDCC